MEHKNNNDNQNKSNGQSQTSRRPRIAGRKALGPYDSEKRPYQKSSKSENSPSGDLNAEPKAQNSKRNHHGKSHSQRPYGPNANKKKFTADKSGKDPQRVKKVPVKKEKTPPPTPKPYDGTTRLNKYIANAGICSRREADKLIAAGSITVNGKVVTEMGYQVHEGDVVNYGGETLRSERKRYFLLNKPKGFITTVDDPQNRETVMMLIDGACPERIYPVGRLDRNTTGLLLFTNDGDLARHLTHPSTGVYKIYQVELDKPVTRNDMKQMLEGVELEDGPIHVDDIQYVQGANDKRIVGVELHSGKNRIVRRLFEHFGYNVHKLDRVVFAGLTKKDLPRGRYRELTEKEVGYLMMI
jgi:23S rRNA pseudouridine2605 synthase